MTANRNKYDYSYVHEREKCVTSYRRLCAFLGYKSGLALSETTVCVNSSKPVSLTAVWYLQCSRFPRGEVPTNANQ